MKRLFIVIFFPYLIPIYCALMVYKYTVKYIFLCLDIIILHNDANPYLKESYPTVKKWILFFAIKIWFYHIPKFIEFLKSFFTKERWLKISLAIFHYYDDKLYNMTVYIERFVPKNKARIRRLYWRLSDFYYDYDYVFTSLFTKRGVKVVKTAIYCYFKTFISSTTLRMLYINLVLLWMEFKIKLITDWALWKWLIKYIINLFDFKFFAYYILNKICNLIISISKFLKFYN